MARIYLIDTLYQIFRAFHALPPMRSPEGVPTQAVHGVLGIFSNLWRAEQVEYAVAVFESMTGTFREELFPDYKAHREAPDPDLLTQIPLVEEACRRLGIATLERDRYEADDVMATLARRAAAAGHEAVIVSNDKDLAQVLTHPNISLLRLAGSGKKARLERIYPADVAGVYGVEAHQIPAWLALHGDSVDNIPGISGVGPKTAARWLAQHGTFEALLEGPPSTGRFAETLRQEADRLRRDLHLATVADDIDLGFTGFPLEEFRPRSFAGSADFFRGLGMRRTAESLEGLLFDRPTVANLWT